MEKLTRQQFDQAVSESPSAKPLAAHLVSLLKGSMSTSEVMVTDLTAQHRREREEISARQLRELKQVKEKALTHVEDAWKAIADAQGLESMDGHGMIETEDGRAFTISTEEGERLQAQLGCTCGMCDDGGKSSDSLKQVIAAIIGIKI